MEGVEALNHQPFLDLVDDADVEAVRQTLRQARTSTPPPCLFTALTAGGSRTRLQLEAMAAGIPSLAFRLPRSGMAWVCELPGLTWPGAPADLAAVLQRLAAEPAWRAALGRQARDRYLQLFARQVWQRQLEGLNL